MSAAPLLVHERPPLAPVADPVVSIVIVHYNTEELTRACLTSIRDESRGLPCEVLLVDNGSQDGSGLRLAEAFPEVHLLRLEKGVGYAASNNAGARLARGRHVLFLNSDTEIQDDALRKVSAFLDEHPRVGLAGCRLLLADGTLDGSCRRSFPTPTVALWKMLGLNKLFPRSPRFAAYDLRYLPVEGRYPVDSLVGAFIMGRREALPEGPFDEDYFFYGEDIDLCLVVKQAGWEVWYLGDVAMLHRKGGTTNKREPWVIFHFHEAMRIYYNKHCRSRYPLPVTLLVHLGIYLRLAAHLARNLFKSRRPS